MIPPPPSSTLFPYTTLFRSPPARKERRSGTESAGRPRTYRCCLPRAPMIPLLDRGKAGASSPSPARGGRSEEHTSELQSRRDLVCRLLLEKKKKKTSKNK